MEIKRHRQTYSFFPCQDSLDIMHFLAPTVARSHVNVVNSCRIFIHSKTVKMKVVTTLLKGCQMCRKKEYDVPFFINNLIIKRKTYLVIFIDARFCMC